MNDMKLELRFVRIDDVQFGPQTTVRDHVLFINKEEMLAEIADPFFSGVEIELARPGESVRIIPVKDVIEPRIKISEPGRGGSFPGYFGRFEDCGEGVTQVLEGCSVVTTGTIVGFQEGLIDMSGKGAEFCYFSKLNNVVIKADAPEGVHPTKHEEAVRVLGLKAAHYLAEQTMEAAADRSEIYELPAVKDDLPRVGVIYMVMAQGLVHDNYVYGIDCKRLHPTLMHPNEVFDGAIVNGTCVVAGDKNTTYDHQNNPLLKELYARHGLDLNFVGCLVTPTYTVLKDKERCSAATVRMARLLKLDGVCIPQEGGGNPEADLMKMIKGCENNGIKTVGMVTAIGGEEGISDTTEEADAIINVGDDEERVILPPMERVIGYPEQVDLLSGGALGSLREDGSIEVSIIAIMCSTNQMGMTRLSSKVS